MKRLVGSFVCILAIMTSGDAQAQFTSGNVIVLQAGTGAAALTNTATPVLLKEYNTSTLNQSTSVTTIYVDTTGAARLTISGTATSEGQMTLSSDSTKLVIAGYDAAIGTTVATVASSIVPRAIDTVGYVGVAGRADTTKTVFSAGNIRSAARNSADNYWATGSNTGIYYMGNLASPDTVYNTSTNLRVIQAANGKLYFSTASVLSRIGRINSQPNTGLTTADTMITLGTGTTPSPYGFIVNSAESIVYVADDRTTASGGGIQKWTRSGTTWILAYTLNTGTSGARSVVADWSGTNAVLYAITASTPSTLIKFTDSNATAPAQILATAPTNTAFRSVAFAPKLASCTPPAAFITAVTSTTACQGDSVVLSTNSAPDLKYVWKRGGSIVTGAADSVLKAYGSGQYQVVVSNTSGCKDSSGTVTVVINPLPVATINPGFTDTICAGDTISLRASSGTGNTYRWMVGSTGFGPSADSNFVFITPALVSDSNYRIYVVVRSANNCVDSSVAQSIQVQGLPNPVIVNNAGVLSTGTYAQYQWYLNGVLIPGANVMSYTPTVNGDYIVSVISSGGCSGNSAIMTVTGLGVPNTLAQSGVRLYPNPAYDALRVEAVFNVIVVLKDLQGRIVGRAEREKTISLQNLTPGIYVASVYDENGALIGTQLLSKVAR